MTVTIDTIQTIYYRWRNVVSQMRIYELPPWIIFRKTIIMQLKNVPQEE
jgi:hypothetical protein